MNKFKFWGLSFVGILFLWTNIYQSIKSDNNNCLKLSDKSNFEKNMYSKYFELLKKVKYLSTYQNVSLFQSENNKNLFFNGVNNNYINVFNETTNSSFSLVFLNNEFLINKNIKNNYQYLIGTLNSRLELKDTKNYAEKIENFDYQSDSSFKFNGSVVSNDNHSQRQFSGVVKDKNLINFNVKYFDWNPTKWGFWKIFQIVMAAIAAAIAIACGLYGLAGYLGYISVAGAGTSVVFATEGAAVGTEGAIAGADATEGAVAGFEGSIANGNGAIAGASEATQSTLNSINSVSNIERILRWLRENRSEDNLNNVINNNTDNLNNNINENLQNNSDNLNNNLQDDIITELQGRLNALREYVVPVPEKNPTSLYDLENGIIGDYEGFNISNEDLSSNESVFSIDSINSFSSEISFENNSETESLNENNPNCFGCFGNFFGRMKDLFFGVRNGAEIDNLNQIPNEAYEPSLDGSVYGFDSESGYGSVTGNQSLEEFPNEELEFYNNSDYEVSNDNESGYGFNSESGYGSVTGNQSLDGNDSNCFGCFGNFFGRMKDWFFGIENGIEIDNNFNNLQHLI